MVGKNEFSSEMNLRLLERLRVRRPRTRKELAGYVEAFLGLKIPSKKICGYHDSPLDYLAGTFLNEGGVGHDIIVWANRGGGKTQLGAIASLLECVFFPDCQVRILGGSEDQSQRMYQHLRRMLERDFGEFVSGGITARGCRFGNGAAVQVLTQSQKSVRGHHVQRLRCDEVELFEPDVWQASQFVPQSSGEIVGRLEALSTMHRPYGLMSEIVGRARESHTRVFRWCLWEVIEQCRDRVCSRCALLEDCRGRAKGADGYYSIDDAIAQKRRSSRGAWRSEMLCLEPSREDTVFAEFNPGLHVRALQYHADRPLYRTIDFGFSNPLACLLIQVDKDDNVLVLDEHIKSRTTLAEHARLIKERWPWPVEATYCDPAGRQRNDITGTAAVQELAALGMPTQSRASRIVDGIEMMRSFLAPAEGPCRLFISPKCEHLIRAMLELHYAKGMNGILQEVPEKDGVHDHIIDALRYFFVNRFARRYEVKIRKY
jgi:hypothetical protein